MLQCSLTFIANEPRTSYAKRAAFAQSQQVESANNYHKWKWREHSTIYTGSWPTAHEKTRIAIKCHTICAMIIVISCNISLRRFFSRLYLLRWTIASRQVCCECAQCSRHTQCSSTRSSQSVSHCRKSNVMIFYDCVTQRKAAEYRVTFIHKPCHRKIKHRTPAGISSVLSSSFLTSFHFLCFWRILVRG